MLEPTSPRSPNQEYRARGMMLRRELEDGSLLESFPPPLVSKPSFTMSIGDDYTDDGNGRGPSESTDTPSVEVAQQSSIRWVILILSCFLLFGNYFAYDNPAALNTQLQKYLDMPYDDYQYLLSALYSIYSLPNTVLPFVFGHLVDRFGAHHMLLFLSGCVCVGQALFSLGVQYRAVGWMLIGRGIFGIGGESCGVAQASITTRFFRGHELAFALGLNLCISRFGSVVNTLVTPWVEQQWNVTVAVWVGTLSCVLSFVSAVVLIGLMVKVERQTYRPLEPAFSNSSTSVVDASDVGSSTAVSEDSDSRVGLYRVASNNSPASPHPSSTHSVVFTPGHSKLGRAPSLHIITDQSFLETPKAAPVATWQEAWWDGLHSFPTTFWLVCSLTILLYGTVVPFNNIASDFLQSKWFPGNPRKATAVMGIPDTVGSVLVPVFGMLVDKYGGRASALIVSACIMVTVHSTLGFTMLNPIFAFSLLGVAYSMYGVALWPSIACVVKDEVHLGMGYGISTSALNISLTVVPPIVAIIRIVGNSFMPVEMFFIGMGLVGIVVGLMLKSIDAQQGGALEAPEIEVEVPVIVPPPGAGPSGMASPDAVFVSPLLSPQVKYQSKSLGRNFSEHVSSPLGIYQHSWDYEGAENDADQDLNHGQDDDSVPLVGPALSPNQGHGRSRSREKRALSAPWNHFRAQKTSPSRLHGLRRIAPHRARAAIPRSLTGGRGGVDNPLLPPSRQYSAATTIADMASTGSSSTPATATATATAAASRPRFYGSFSSPSIASLRQGVGIVVDEEATLHDSPLSPSVPASASSSLLRPLPPRHQYSVRQHPILHNPLRGSSGSFRIHRNARHIGFGEGEEGNLFLNGFPVSHPEDLQSALLSDDANGGALAGVQGRHGVQEDDHTEAEEDDADGTGNATP